MRQRELKKGGWRWGLYAMVIVSGGYVFINTHLTIIHPTGGRPTISLFWLPNHQNREVHSPVLTVQL